MMIDVEYGLMILGKVVAILSASYANKTCKIVTVCMVRSL